MKRHSGRGGNDGALRVAPVFGVGRGSLLRQCETRRRSVCVGTITLALPSKNIGDQYNSFLDCEEVTAANAKKHSPQSNN